MSQHPVLTGDDSPRDELAQGERARLNGHSNENYTSGKEDGLASAELVAQDGARKRADSAAHLVDGDGRP